MLPGTMDILSEVFEHLPVPCLHLNFAGMITHMNLEARKLLGKLGQAAEHSHYLNIFTAELQPGCAKAIEKAISQKQSCTCEFKGDSSRGWTGLTVRPLSTGVMLYFNTGSNIQKWPGEEAGILSHLEDLELQHMLRKNEAQLLQLAEQERFKNYVLMQQIEDLARTGSWEYVVATGTLTWSEGMYRLFDLERGVEIRPEIYLEYAKKESRSAARRIVEHLRSGNQDFEEKVEIRVGGKTCLLHLKARVIKNDKAEVTRILGVDLDVTALQEVEKMIRRMESMQRQEIFSVTLNTQEEERRRISESLHNGLAQLLYGIKLSLSVLDSKLAVHNPDKYMIARKYTDSLLDDAIKETRRISHELMPAVLSEFGLGAAIDEVCKQLQNGTKFNCTVTVGHVQLENYLELAAFRTVQELMVNVVKHAEASQANVLVTVKKNKLKIRVDDNGKGMPAVAQQKPGIGLASIRNKVELLNGSLSLHSGKGNGTVIEVCFPIPAEKSSSGLNY